MHEDALRRDTSLPGGDESGEGDAVDGLVQVGVVKDEHGSVPAQFGAVVLHLRTRERADRAPGRGAARKVDLHHIGMLHERPPSNWPKAGAHVDRARRRARLSEAACELDDGRRRELGWLDHDRVARRERHRHLLRRDQQRVVPRRDQTAHAEWPTAHNRQVVSRVGKRRHRALDALGQRGVILKPFGYAAQLRLVLATRAARRTRLQLNEQGQPLAKLVGSRSQDPASTARAHSLPVAFFMAALGRGNGRCNVCLGAQRRRSKRGRRGGVLDRKCGAVDGLGGLAVEPEWIVRLRRSGSNQPRPQTASRDRPEHNQALHVRR